MRAGHIDSLALTTGNTTATVQHDERDGFSSKYREETVSENTIRMFLEIVDLNFRKSSWKVSDGGEPYGVEIEDTQFLSDVASGRIRFGNGDSLDADVQVIQRRVNVNLRTDRTIVKVHEVIQAPPGDPQLELDA